MVLLFDVFRFGFAAVFVTLHVVLMAAFMLEWRRDRRAAVGGSAFRPRVSVIIPFRNEERRMRGLLISLRAQDYPAAEYIFVDDRSTDKSPAMIADFARFRTDCRVITLKENTAANPKQYAIGRGIEAAGGELFLFTDADCEVPPGWIAAMTRRMADARTGTVIGPVFKKSGEKGFFHFYQCIDHAIRYMYLTASTGLGAAGGGFGNNLIIRRECLDRIGGYDSVPFSPTEDAALISRIRARTDFRIRSAAGTDTHVFTLCENSWGAFLNQTLRWNNGGLFSPDPSTRLNFGLLVISISLGIAVIPLLPLYPALWPLPAAVLCSMIMNTLATLRLGGNSLPRGLGWYVVQLLFTPAWMTLLTILGFSGARVEWKGESVRRES